MQKAHNLYVIGIGYRPLPQRAKDILAGAGVVLASRRLFDVFQRYDEYETVKDRIKVINKVPETIDFMKERFSAMDRDSACRPVVLLASGDPLFFGIGRRIREEFGKEMVEILPDLSSVQEAFARINEPWDDAFFISLHGGPDIAKRRKLHYEISDIPDLLERYHKIGILTDKENNPVRIARFLQSAVNLSITVCERLGYPDEKIIRGAPDEIAGMSFSEPNVVIIRRPEGREQKAAGREGNIRFGLTEDGILHERGLITKDEVRAVTIHKLRLPGSGVFWDIGAGSGAVSLEAARLCPGLKIFAIEKDLERIKTVRMNLDRYNIVNVEIVHGAAPGAVVNLPAPDRVFIGGSGGNLNDIVKIAGDRMHAGIVVINAATLETLRDALSALENNRFSAEVSEISVARSKLLGGRRQMTALNPVFIVPGERLR